MIYSAGTLEAGQNPGLLLLCKGAIQMLFTCEQVSAGHPDKLCGQISDAIVTDCMKHDRNSRVAVECMIKDYDITISGEVTSSHEPLYAVLARRALLLAKVPNYSDYKVTTHISRQSPDIALGVDNKGAGDQGIVYGYATSETSEMLPIPFVLATCALEKLSDKVGFDRVNGLLPDAKSQVTYDYSRHRIDTFLISVQHRENMDMEDVRHLVRNLMIETANYYGMNTDFKVLVNPTSRFVIGGSFADTGVTGRKIVADTYGGACRHGGGAFSGKDPTKVDRSGAYMARYIAKHIVFSRLADECQVAISYAIGKAEPVAVQIDTFGTGKVSDEVLAKAVNDIFDMRPAAIINRFNLKTYSFADYSAYGHFGNGYPAWEHMEQYEELREAVKKYENDN